MPRKKDFKEKNSKDFENLIYHISHDLHEPIRTISRFVSLLVDQIPKDSKNDQMDQYIEFIESASKRMKDRINGLTQYLKAENIKPRFVSSTEVIEILKSAILELRKSIQVSKAKIQVEKSYPAVFFDPDALRLIFYHLIENAIKFQEKDSTPVVEIKGKKAEGDFVQFLISDNGIGIHEDHLDKIYSLFQRLHPVDEYTGVGAGLGFVKRSLDCHGGKIEIQSKNGSKGKGSTFSLTLPTKKV